jgi:flagellar FliL protein
MAEEKTNADAPETAAPPAKSGGFKAWLPLLATLIVMPALAFGMTQFVLLPQIEKELGVKAAGGSDAAGKGKKEDPNAKKESVMMNKLLVNIAGTMGARYLLVSMSVVGSSANFKDKMQENDAALRDMACGALSTKTLADLEKPDARNLIRTELITGFNNILGDSMVQEIYFTEFAIQ